MGPIPQKLCYDTSTDETRLGRKLTPCMISRKIPPSLLFLSSYVPPLWLARVTVSNGLNSLQLRPSSQHDPQKMCNLEYSPRSLQPRPILCLPLRLLLLLMGPNKGPPPSPFIPMEKKNKVKNISVRVMGKD